MVDQGFIEREQHNDLRDLISRPHSQRATVTVGPSDGLTTAHNRLRNAGFSQLPVMQDQQLIGIISEDDIIRFAFGAPERFSKTVADAMHANFLQVESSMSIQNLVALLDVQPCAAVMANDQFLGLVTRTDVLNHLRRQVQSG